MDLADNSSTFSLMKQLGIDTNVYSLIDWCITIEKEYDNLDNIHLSVSDYEDTSELFQAKLELKWHKEELEKEYKQLNKRLGYTKRELADKSSRRTGM